MNLKKKIIGIAFLAVLSMSAEAAGEWVDKISMKGDFRYRHEWIDEAGKDTRDRQRIRARLYIDAQVTDTVKVKTGLATGSDDPVSTNETLDNGFSTKDIKLDQAYFEWTPESAGGLAVWGGKMKMPFEAPEKSDLVWDGDLSPEGLALLFRSDDSPFFATLSGLWVDEKSSADDAFLYGAQAGLQFKGDVTFTLGASYYTYTEAKGFAPYYDPMVAFGNKVDMDGNYINDFDIMEAFIAAKTKLGDLPFAIYAHYVTNGDADDDDTGYLAGFSLGSAKDAGQWAFKYNYRKLEANAVVGAFTDSDSGGGGTDIKGHKIGLEIGLAKNWTAGITYFMNDKKISTSSVDYDRGQIDLVFKY